MSLRFHVLLGLIVILGIPAWSQSGPAIEALLNRELAGQSVIQKRFACGEKVRYSTADKTLTAPLGSWTSCANLRVQAVRLVDDHTIEIRGERMSLAYDPRRRDFGVLKADRKKPSPVVITIEGATPFDEPMARAAVAAIFLQKTDHLSDFVPDYWKPFLIQREIDRSERPKSDAVKFPNLARVGGHVSAPRAVSTPDPDYDPVAKKASFQGTCMLQLGVDESGRPRDIRIAQPLGLGLDDKAVEAVSKWKFDPAKRDGTPVAVQILVEVNFRLY